ncbi:MAG: Glycosyl transferase group 1 [Candidatus Woesebacteria bacterium GW2011_GWB1_39_12]|uniref:Glycosyl transferase group 1 n=2 Tax=Candidatus Woeseibacteriota TaxID=1752722 RepID=A0A0G0Q9N4_9BACT|nr:MAG: Glycosyl transferase group 1 [Candidatus Woesebacteria bacterium GW2011_GWA1_39_12]KKR01481.1 MAG: Glycosyl transferase group 1 [Candidatus Woesebacteria bacterium GW2011_GWB1_39_12]
MHIGFLTSEYPLNNTKTGGLGTYIRKTALELNKRGQKVSIFWESIRNAKSNDRGIVVYEIKCPPLYYALNSQSLIKQLIRVSYVLYSAFKIRNKVFQVHKETPLEIIQAPNHLAPGYFIKQNNKIPVVARVSSYAPLYHAAFGVPRTFGDYLIDYLELRQVTGAKAGFSPSHFMQKVYSRYENCNLDFVPTAVEVRKPEKTDNSVLKKILRQFPSKQYLLYFGSMSRIKGVDLMADVINKLAPKYPRLCFVFIGVDYGLPSGEPISSFIFKNCDKYKERIIFLPFKQHWTLYPVIKRSLVVVAPSRVDNYPNACIEAQSLGIPVIGTTDSSIDEIIVDGKTGFIAENSSAISLVSKIEKLINMNKKERVEMRKNIEKNMIAIFAEDRIKLLIKYYEKVIQKNKE